MKKVISLFIVMMLMLTAVACGDEPSSDQLKYDVTIVVDDLVQDKVGLNNWIKNRQEAFNEANPTIQVKHVAELGTDAFNQISAIKNAFAIQNENTPTILNVNTNETARQLYSDGDIGVFTSQINSWVEKNNISSNVLEGFTVNNEVVGFPVTVETPLLGFNKNVLKERQAELLAIGQDYESLNITSWEDYKEIASVLTYTNSENQKVSGAGMTTQDYYQSFGIWSTANGFDAVTQNANGTIAIEFSENESMKETLMFFADMIEDDTIVYNRDVSIETYYGYIWSNRMASFTYYPAWATWFGRNGLDSSNIDVYNFPKGEYAKTNNIQGTNAMFTTGYVIDRKATDKQIDASAKYLEFMYGKDAWESKIDFAYNNMIQFVQYPTLNNVSLEKIYEDLSNNWKTAIDTSLKAPYVSRVNSSAYTTEIRAKLSDLVGITDQSSLTSMLEQLEKTTKLNWLNAYNDRLNN